MGSVFGGGGGQTSTTTSVQELSPEQRQLIDLVIPTASAFAKTPPQLFPKSSIAGFDPLQTAAQQNLLDAVAPLTQQANTTLQGQQTLLQGGLQDTGAQVAQQRLLSPTQSQAGQFLLDPQNLFSNPALSAATDAAIRPLTEAFTQNVLPGLRQGAITSGQFGGSRQGIAEGEATQAFFNSAGDVSSRIQSQAFQDSLQALVQSFGIQQQGFGVAGNIGLQRQNLTTQAMLGGLQGVPQALQSVFAPSQVLDAVGQQRQALTQGRLSEQAQRFIAEQTIPFATAQDIAALAFGLPGGQTSSVAKGPGPTQNLGSTLLGIASLASLFV